MNDEDYMRLAFEEARRAEIRGDLPIAALLIINGDLIGKNSSRQNTDNNYFSHAESILIGNYASEIKRAHKDSKNIILYSTLEPCFMCFGTLVHNRINRIVYSCPDPVAGVTHIKPPTDFYAKRWPLIKGDVLREDGYNLFLNSIKKTSEVWSNCIQSFEEMKSRWEDVK